MTPKEANEYYGKELASCIWEHLNLSDIKVDSTPDGLDIPKYEWESARLSLIE